ILGAASLKSYGAFMEGFYAGLREAGFVAGQNLTIEQRWADGDYARARQMAAELVEKNPRAIFASGNIAAVEAKKATSTIPIVFAIGIDPVRYGFVQSLAKPGTNATGAVVYTSDLVPKRLGILFEAVPSASLIGFLGNSKNANFEEDAKA